MLFLAFAGGLGLFLVAWLVAGMPWWLALLVAYVILDVGSILLRTWRAWADRS